MIVTVKQQGSFFSRNSVESRVRDGSITATAKRGKKRNYFRKHQL